jgi:glycosyltransferase involved in cell wall biosynthesis
MSPLNIFVPHCSDLLTDHRPHGDGLIAHGFIRNLAERGHNLYVAAQEVDLRNRLPANVHVFPTRVRHKNQFVSRIAYMSEVRKLFLRLRRQVHFDIVHQMNPVYTGISLSLLGTGTPTVLGTYVARWPDSAEVNENRSVASRFASVFHSCVAGLQQGAADRLLLTGPAAANRLVPFASIRVPRSYIAHGIDAEFFSPGEREAEDAKGLSVLYFAHITKRKGVFDAVSAFADVVNTLPDCILCIAGTGPETEAVQNLAERLGIAARVRFLGHIDRLSAPGIYRSGSIYCLPSNGEPYATTVIEAMSCGKPIVYTNAGGLPHMVGAEGGIGVEVGDVKGLSQALCCLLANPARRREMGEHNRRRVLETMTWDRVIDHLEEIYIDTIHSKRYGKRREHGERTAPVAMRAPSPEDCA